MEKKKPKTVTVIDTYALLAMAYGELGRRAESLLRGIREKSVVGIIPVTVVYEYIVHWLRGRIPVFRSLEEVLTFLSSYFKVEALSLADWVEAARIKHRGDLILSKAGAPKLRGRRLSIVDSTILVVANKHRAPIVSGDSDLTYVAERIGVKVVW